MIYLVVQEFLDYMQVKSTSEMIVDSENDSKEVSKHANNKSRFFLISILSSLMFLVQPY